MAKIIEQLRGEVEASSKTRYRIAQDSGVSAAALSRLVHGQRGLTIESAERVADALGMELVLRRRRRGRQD